MIKTINRRYTFVPSRWLVIEFSHSANSIRRESEALVTTEDIDKPVDNIEIYWGGGPGHCNTKAFHNVIILKDYGVLTEDEELEVHTRFAKDFPRKPYQWLPGEHPQGFIHPDGTLWAAENYDHSGLASDLLKMFDLDNGYGTSQDLLESAGWITVRHRHITMDWETCAPTLAQLATIKKLIEHVGPGQDYQHCLDNLKELTEERWPKEPVNADKIDP